MPENPEDLADKITQYFQSDLYLDLSENRNKIIQYAKENHSWEKTGDTVDSPLNLVELQIFERGGKNRIQPLEHHDTLDLQRGEDGRLYVNNTLLIRLNPPLTKARLQQILSSLGATITESFPGAGIIRLHLPDSIDPHEAAEVISGYDEVSLAEPDYAYSLEGNERLAVDVELPELK